MSLHRPGRGRVGRRMPVWLAVFALLAAAPAASAHPRHLGLGDVGLFRGVLMGSAVDVDALANEPQYRDVLAREFRSVTAENVMKWQTVEPQRGVDDFAAADRLVAFARSHRQSVYGHTLLWHNQLPTWLTAGVADGSIDNAQLKQILRRHVFAVVGHFRGRVRAWDAVNEVIDDNAQFRDTLWLRAFGPDYIEWVLRWAHQADPHVQLVINDYNIEGVNAKSDAYYALVRDLMAKRVPIDAIGIQGHLSLGERGQVYGFPSQVPENVRRFARLGLAVNFTEADVRMELPVTDEKLARQADFFRQLLDACLSVRSCHTFTVWGFTDAHSWVPGFFTGQGAATPFTETYQPKPAYFALRRALLGLP
jgi:endo-1,4-beta-xylanase